MVPSSARGGRVIVVFGAGGDRDRAKRPLMGAVAARLADMVVITSDNPRSEEPAAIIEEILAGVADDDRGRVEVQLDRAEAIRHAIALAEPGDMVIIAGKGHETHSDHRRPGDRRSTTARSSPVHRASEHGPARRVIAIMIAGVVGGVVSLFATRALITLFRTRGLGQPILGKEDRGPEHHMAKQGTPTMGGIAILVAALAGWLAAHVREGLPFSTQALIVWVGHHRRWR